MLVVLTLLAGMTTPESLGTVNILDDLVSVVKGMIAALRSRRWKVHFSNDFKLTRNARRLLLAVAVVD
jgi:hypothetical protein